MAVEFPLSYPGFSSYAEQSTLQAQPGAPGKVGELSLVFEASENRRTQLVRDRARVPYHLSGTLAHDPHPSAATVCIQSTTGGIAQGDRLEANVRVGRDAIAVVSTQSATKVQSMNRNYATERTTLTVDAGGHLDYVPEPTILHANARFARETEIRLEPGATAVLGDVFVPGRLAHGERFDFEEYVSRTHAGEPNGTLFEDTTHLRPGRDRTAVSAPGVHGERPVCGSLYVLAGGGGESTGNDSLADRIHGRVADRSHGGATMLPNNAGVLVRVLTTHSETATEVLHEAWDIARHELIGAGAPDSRRY